MSSFGAIAVILRRRRDNPTGDDFAYHEMEEGISMDMSKETWNFMNMAIRCVTTVIGTGMLAYIFLSRFVYHDPKLQDPCKMIARVALVLLVLGTGYLPLL